MYCVHKTPTRTDSDSTNVRETDQLLGDTVWTESSKGREKRLVVSVGRLTNSWSNSRVSMWTGREDKDGWQGWCWYQWWNTNTESLCWLPQSTHSAECSPFCCKPRDAVTELSSALALCAKNRITWHNGSLCAKIELVHTYRRPVKKTS